MTTIPIWLAVLLAVAGPLIAFVGLLSSQKMRNTQEAERRAHEQQLKNQELEHAERMKQMELDEARQQRLRDDRIKAYMSFAKMTATVNPREEYALSDLAEGFAEIEVLGSSEEAVRWAKDLYDWSLVLRERSREAYRAGEDPTKDAGARDALAYVRNARELFMKAARDDVV